MAFYYFIRVIARDCVLEIEMGQSPKELDGGERLEGDLSKLPCILMELDTKACH